jgi:hypothetical protein
MNFYCLQADPRKRFCKALQDFLGNRIRWAADNPGEILTIRHGPARKIRGEDAGSGGPADRIADSREAPTCMRCRGLTWPNHGADLPIARLACALAKPTSQRTSLCK